MKCPYCGQTLEYEDYYDTEELDERYIRKEFYVCPKCHRNYSRYAYYSMEYLYDTWEET